ncbi:MAG: OmpA family protein [Phycisphaerae bacterium]|nr:OmpA family protein [Saprospiraceae bacterium]
MDSKSLFLFIISLLSLSSNVHAQQGLLAEYFNGKNFDQKVLTRTDAQINFVWDNVAPAPGLDPHVFSVRWTGKIKSPETGTYLFRAHVDDGIRVMVDGKKVINAWGMHDSERFVGEIYLKAGQQYSLQVEYFNALFEGEIQLFWQLPSEAPVFQGLLGYNDHLIDSRFFSLPVSPPKPITPTSTKPVIPTAKQPVAKQLPTPLKPAKIAKDTLEKYLPKNILFVKSKSIMLPESEPELDRLAGFLLRNPKYGLAIEGHTDHIGDAAKNLLLSEQRAQTVAIYLTQKGIAAQRITTKGYGDTRPLVREQAGVPNEKNRRVEFLIQE